MTTATLDKYVPGEIPTDDALAPPSVWAPGDVHHTMEQIHEESPAGVAPLDPRDMEIMRLQAEVALLRGAPDPKDVEIANLKALLAQPAPAKVPDGPVQAVASETDPRDDEIAQLKAQLAAK